MHITISPYEKSVHMSAEKQRKQKTIVCRRFETPSPSIDNHPIWPSLLLFFPQTFHFWQDFSDNINSVKCQIDTKINSCDKVISLFLED